MSDDNVTPLGPTGEYPQGKLTEDDNGELQIAVGTIKGKIMIKFFTPVTWIGFGKQEALAFAETIREKAEKLS